ncbi:MAG: hypothetical protein IOC66_21825 [Burkholderia sp.]|nr:hypothetical protein [Burkholderia sp.]
MSPPSGFRFSTRCPFAFDCCQQEEPSLQADEDDRTVACHLYDLPDAHTLRTAQLGGTIRRHQLAFRWRTISAVTRPGFPPK